MVTPHRAPSRRSLLAALAFSPVAALAQAPTYPDRPLRMVVPFPAGGAADVMARGLALHLGEALGQSVVIENQGGAGGTTAAEKVARAPADGYTLLFGTMGTQAINVSMYPKLRYDPLKDFAPISLTHITPRVLVVGPSLQARSIPELVALARAQPGRLSYGSAGNGSSSHLAGALFESLADVKMVHVPYKGSAPLMVDVLAGRIDMTFDSYTVYEEHIQAGKVRALGVTSERRMEVLPQVPTIAESGLRGYDVSNWLGLLAPAGTPAPVVERLHAAAGRAMSHAELRTQLKRLGIEPTSSTPQAFQALIRAEIPKWGELVRKSGAVVD